MTTAVYGGNDNDIEFMSALGTKYLISEGWGANTLSTLVADRVYYIPYRPRYKKDIEGIGIVVTTGAGTNMRLGLYEVDPDGNPGDLLITSGDLDPSSIGLKADTTFTTQPLDKVNYYIAVVSDGATAVRANNVSQFGTLNPLGIDTDFSLGGILTEDTPAWSTLPATAAATPTYNSGFAPPRICLKAL